MEQKIFQLRVKNMWSGQISLLLAVARNTSRHDLIGTLDNKNACLRFGLAYFRCAHGALQFSR